MPRRCLHVALSSVLTLGLACGCGSSNRRTDGPGYGVPVPPAPVGALPDAVGVPPIEPGITDPPVEVYRGDYDPGVPFTGDVDLSNTTPTSDTSPGETVENPFELPPRVNGNPYDTPAYDPRAATPVEAPRPDVSPDEVLKRLGGTVDLDASGRIVLIDLSNSRVQDADLAALSGLGDLGQLDLSSTAVSDNGLRHISSLSKLQLLALSGTGVTDTGLRYLEGMRLRFLLLGFTAVSDDGIETLTRMTQLEGLSLRGTRLTAEGIARLKKALPNCRIVADEPRVPAPVASPALTPPVQTAPTVEPTPAPREDGGTVPMEDAGDAEGPTLGESALRSELISGLPTGTVLRVDAFDLSEAEIQLARIAMGNLADPGTYDAIGEYLSLTGRRSTAIPWLRAAVEAAPNERLYRYHLAIALARTGRTQAALPHFVQAVGSAGAHYNLGVIAYRNGDIGGSRRYFAEAARQNRELAAATAWLDRIDRDLAARTASRGTTAR